MRTLRLIRFYLLLVLRRASRAFVRAIEVPRLRLEEPQQDAAGGGEQHSTAEPERKNLHLPAMIAIGLILAAAIASFTVGCHTKPNGLSTGLDLFGSLIVAIFTGFLTWFGWDQLRALRSEVRVAAEANKLAARALELQEDAFLMPHRPVVDIERAVVEWKSDMVEVVLTVRNLGKSAAIGLHVLGAIQVWPPKEDRLTPIRTFRWPDRTPPPDGTIRGHVVIAIRSESSSFYRLEIDDWKPRPGEKVHMYLTVVYHEELAYKRCFAVPCDGHGRVDTGGGLEISEFQAGLRYRAKGDPSPAIVRLNR